MPGAACRRSTSIRGAPTGPTGSPNCPRASTSRSSARASAASRPAHQSQRLGIPYTIFERRDEVGGVWSTNKYPDARVDTASTTYEYNFEKNYPWTEYFARQPEVQGYIEYVAKKHGVWDNLRFNSDLKEARFDDAAFDMAPDDRATRRDDLRDRRQRRRQRGRRVRKSAVRRLPGQRRFRRHRSCTRRSGVPATTTSRASRSPSSATARPACSWSPRSRRQPSSSTCSSAPRSGSARARSTASRSSPRSAGCSTPCPVYWNWQRYTATSALFDSHELMVIDPDWIAQGGFVNQKNDAIRDRPHRLHQVTGR